MAPPPNERPGHGSLTRPTHSPGQERRFRDVSRRPVHDLTAGGRLRRRRTSRDRAPPGQGVGRPVLLRVSHRPSWPGTGSPGRELFEGRDESDTSGGSPARSSGKASRPTGRGPARPRKDPAAARRTRAPHAGRAGPRRRGTGGRPVPPCHSGDRGTLRSGVLTPCPSTPGLRRAKGAGGRDPSVRPR